MDELAHEVEHAVARPGLLPEIGRGVALPRGRHGRVAGAAELALVEGQEARPRAREARRHVDEIRVDGEVREAAAIGQERLARVAVGLVLPDRVLDVLPGERVLEFGGKDRHPVQEEHEVEALLVLRAVAELAHHGEEVRRVQAPRLLVEPARGAEPGEPELAARVPEAVPQHIQRAAPLDLGGEALEELLPHRRAVVLFELPPLLRLRGEHEVDHVVRQEAERAVVVFGAPPAVAPRRRVTVRRRRLAHRRGIARAGVGAVLEQPALDRLLEGALGDLGAHGRFLPGRARSVTPRRGGSSRMSRSARAQ
ncbi:MAG: hypothetical protein MNPFHGCM_02355 [Gemmatimonadaceae bacterium]|nr:hypothetical protein [Gemmatimonadaceae bacterium]